MIRYFVLSVLLITVACAYDSEEDMFMDNDCQDDNVSFRMHIQPILETNCLGCHGTGINTGGVTLEGYENLKVFVNNGRFLGAVKHESGFSPMPQNANKLPDCQISQIEAWIDDGAENN